ncbi:hypothetical protein [Blastopirellula marina]|uniref:Uncharacterized protein n=1 Tax=Blastopirellula marina DSM 3645 TaxID=314230 RepID=A3ZQV1_9BACT|nr:hypothetical protein [Blastopirellula marina]EAQ81041.1 hypothetical protein DSM3645_20757 [Blastopirellula marina DSM 3645]
MANFRCERILLRINEMIRDFDPNAGLNHEELAWSLGFEHDYEPGEPQMWDFVSGPGERPRWHSALKGLNVLRQLIDRLEQKSTAAPESSDTTQKQIEALRSLEDKLDTIDTYDRKFSLLAKDLA